MNSLKIPKGYSIEPANAAHVPLLGAIEIAAATRFPSGTIPDCLRSDSVPVSMLLDALANGTLWVALDTSRQPVGYALVRIFDDFSLLAQMDVHPDHGRKGLGVALVRSVADFLRARDKHVLYLTTFTHVPWNASLYAKIGFLALTEEAQPPFIKSILDEERRCGLTNRIAMSLSL